MTKLKTLTIVLAIVGLMGGTVLVGWYGFGNIADAVFSVGLPGFAWFCLWQAIVFCLLGLSWRVIVPLTDWRQLFAFIWGRMVRDSAGSCLPFSQVGGFLMGARAASLHGIAWPVATISMVVDLTAEFLSELIFAALGLLVLLAHVSDAALTLPIASGIAGASILGLVVYRFQGKAAPLFVRFGQRILGDWQKGGLSSDGLSQMDLAEMYSHTRRVVLATVMHLLGWVGKGIGNWIGFRLLGADIDLMGALAIEGLLHALLIPAFLVPGYAGVQEAGYAGIGALFGIPPELSIGMSLLRRARDIALGIPILLVWQMVEMRGLRIVSHGRRILERIFG